MKKFISSLSVLAIVGLIVSCFGAPVNFNWAAGSSSVPGGQCSGAQQSPINIDRTNLCFGTSIVFENGGFADTSSAAVTVTLPTASSPLLWLEPATSFGTVSPPNLDETHSTVTLTEAVIHSPAEHILNSTGLANPFELQIYGTDEHNSIVGLSFQIVDDDRTGTQKVTLISDILAARTAGASYTYSIQNFAGFGSYLNQFYFQYTQNFARNTKFYMYPGSRTFPPCEAVNWYVFDKPIFITSAEKAKLQALYPQTSTVNGTRAVQPPGTRAPYATGCWPTNFFQNPVRYNYGFWFDICFVLAYFFCTLYSEKELQIVDETYKDNLWTLNPIFSIWNVGAEYYSKGSRLLLLWTSFSTIFVVDSIMFANLGWQLKDGIIIVFPIFGIICSWVTNYIFGYLITRVQRLQRKRYIDKVGGEIEIEVNTAWFIFYFPGYLYIAVCVVVSAWQHSYITSTMGAWWLLSLVIAFAIDQILLDIVMVGLAKCSTGLANWFKYRGYWFDYELYVEYKKQD